MENFPIIYLGLPLSISKLKRAQLQPLIDRLADLLPGWRADLMKRAGRAVHVQFVITATIFACAVPCSSKLWIKFVRLIFGKGGWM
jgi:hypothetical protein